MRFLTQTIATGAALLLAGAANAAVTTYNDLATFQAGSTGLSLIDFDTDTSGNALSGGTQLGSIYSTVGVVFPTGNRVEAGFIQPASDPNGWINDDPNFFDADFTGAGITAVGVHNVLSAGTSTLTAFDAASNVLGSVLSDGDGNTLDFFGLTTMTAIYRIEVTVTGGGWGLDDLYLGQSGASPIPIPGAFGLMVLGLAGFGAVRRGRRT